MRSLDGPSMLQTSIACILERQVRHDFELKKKQKQNMPTSVGTLTLEEKSNLPKCAVCNALMLK